MLVVDLIISLQKSEVQYNTKDDFNINTEHHRLFCIFLKHLLEFNPVVILVR